MYKLRNLAAADVAATINKSRTSQQLYVTPEPISNTLLISGAAADVVKVVKQLNELDLPIPMYMVEFRICTGDPLGSRVAGTMKILAEPKVVTVEGKPAFVRAGGRAVIDGEIVPVGAELKVTVVSAKGEAIRVRLEGANTVVEGVEKEQSLKTVRSFATREVKVGEKTLFRIGQPADALWAEVTVRPVQQMPDYVVPTVRSQTAK